MKRTKLLSIFLIVVFTVVTYSSVLADVSGEKSKLGDLNDQKQEMESEKQELENAKQEAEAYIDEIDGKLTKLATELYNTRQQLKTTQEKIDKTQKKLDEAKESIGIQYEDMKLRIKYMYENGDTQMIDLLLNSKSFTDFLNKAEYITELSQYDRKMLDKLKETKQTIVDSKATLVKEKDNLVALQSEQESSKTKLEALSFSKQQEVKSYENKIAQNADDSAEIEQMIKNQEARVSRAESESIRAAQQETKAPAPANPGGSSPNYQIPESPKPVISGSGFTWPCPGYTSLSSDYGYRSDPFSGASSFHSGIDVPAPAGTPVVAASSGRVEWANYSTTAGNWIGINHGNGVYTIYMHMSALLVSAGTNVSAGQTIGLVGTTGSSTGNHLHFSVRQNGSYVNPWGYLR